MAAIAENSASDEEKTSEVAAAKELGPGGLAAATAGGWSGEDDPEDPLNFPLWRKISIALLYSIGQLVTLMTASVVTPALHQIAEDLGMTDSTAQIAFSVFFLGLGFGPFPVVALAELYGRKPVWLGGCICYVLWNSLSPVGNSPGLMIFGRLMTAAGASAGSTLTGPAMGDMFHAKDRGKSLALATLLPYLGPALGPILGGVVTQHLDWPWLFWILSIFNAVILVVGLFVVKETYAPVLLRKRVARRSSATSRLAVGGTAALRDFLRRFGTSLARPVLMLTKRPVVPMISLLMGINFGTYTLVLSIFAELWVDSYGESDTTSSLNYIAFAIGGILSSQGGGHLMDWIWRALQRRYPDRDPVPEYRLPVMALGGILFPLGILCYGWGAEYTVSWPVVDVGAAIFGLGSFVFSSGLLAYILDEFGDHSASAYAATRMFSYVAGFAFPIFAPQLYATLGYGWGSTLLALLALGLTAPMLAAFAMWGARLRSLGREKIEDDA